MGQYLLGVRATWRASILLILLALAVSFAPAGVQVVHAQTTTIVQWTFQGDTTVPSTGTGTAIRGVGLGASTYPQGIGGAGTTAWNHNNWSLTDLSDALVNSKFIEFRTSTTGFENIAISFDRYRSGTGPQSLEIFYSTDGINYTFATVGPTFTLPAGTTWYSGAFSFGLVPELNDAAMIYLRILGYGATGTGGTMRVDNVTITGEPLPSDGSTSSDHHQSCQRCGECITITC